MARGSKFKLQAKHGKSHYKSVDTWLNSVYRKHKTKIDAGIEAATDPRTTKREQFIELVKEYHEEGYSWKKSLRIYEQSTHWTSVKERLQANAYKALRDDKEAYRQFREMTKEDGRYTSIDWDEIEWDPTEKAYIYKDQIKISFSNSPKETIIEYLDEDDYE